MLKTKKGGEWGGWVYVFGRPWSCFLPFLLLLVKYPPIDLFWYLFQKLRNDTTSFAMRINSKYSYKLLTSPINLVFSGPANTNQPHNKSVEINEPTNIEPASISTRIIHLLFTTTTSNSHSHSHRKRVNQTKMTTPTSKSEALWTTFKETNLSTHKKITDKTSEINEKNTSRLLKIQKYQESIALSKTWLNERNRSYPRIMN